MVNSPGTLFSDFSARSKTVGLVIYFGDRSG